MNRVDVCRNCRGGGTAINTDQEALEFITCPVCEGSGMVQVTKEVYATVVPYVKTQINNKPLIDELEWTRE